MLHVSVNKVEIHLAKMGFMDCKWSNERRIEPQRQLIFGPIGLPAAAARLNSDCCSLHVLLVKFPKSHLNNWSIPQIHLIEQMANRTKVSSIIF